MTDPAPKPAPDTTAPADEPNDAWAEEIERRVRDSEAGGDQGTSWDIVHARLNAKLGYNGWR